MKKLKKKQRLLVVCHDAGGAEVLAGFVHRYLRDNHFYVLAVGPARTVFERWGLGAICLSNNEAASLSQVSDEYGPFDLLLTGTSWSTEIERTYISDAKKAGIRTASYLDHWKNYRERFGYPSKNWKKQIPDEIWVGDREAVRVAKENKFPYVRLVPNQYFVTLRKKIKKINMSQKKSGSGGPVVLFLSEPISRDAQHNYGDARYYEFTEQEVFDSLCRVLRNTGELYTVVIRRHPADFLRPYDRIIKKHGRHLAISYSKENDILRDICCADVVVGMDTMALVTALLAKKKIVSFIPSKKKQCSLPFSKILRLRTETQLQAFFSGNK